MATADLQSLMRMLTPSSYPGQLMMQGEEAYQSLAEALANLDVRAGLAGTDYERNVAEQQYQNEDQITSLINAMANRGTLHSGMTPEQMARIGRANTNALDALARGRQNTLAGIAGERINALGGYNSTMAGIQSAYAGLSTQAIADRIQAESQMAQNRQQIDYNNQLNQQNQMFQQQMLNAYNQPRNDYSDLLNSLTATFPVGTAGTTSATGTTKIAPKPLAPQPGSSYTPRPSSSTTRYPV